MFEAVTVQYNLILKYENYSENLIHGNNHLKTTLMMHLTLIILRPILLNCWVMTLQRHMVTYNSVFTD